MKTKLLQSGANKYKSRRVVTNIEQQLSEVKQNIV